MAGVTRLDSKRLKTALAPTGACPSIEELGTFADGGAGGDPGVARHVAGCVRCRAELAMLAEFEAATPRPEEEASARWIADRLEADVARMTAAVEERPRSPALERAARRWQPRLAMRAAGAALAAAAAVLLVVNLGGQQGAAPALSPDAASAAAVFRSTAVTLVAPLDDVAQPPGELRWEPVPGAASYSVTVTEVDRTEVWSAEVRDPSAPLPAKVRSRVVPGKPFLWQVVAKDAAGATVASSGAQRFRVPPSRPGAPR